MHVNLHYPRVNGEVELSVSLDGVRKVFRVRRDPFSEELMDEMKDLIGDGKARASVSCDMSAKEYGNGAGVSVTLSVSVNQTEADLAEAIKRLGARARAFAKEQLVLAGQEYNSLMAK
jgi:hypothetical protein